MAKQSSDQTVGDRRPSGSEAPDLTLSPTDDAPEPGRMSQGRAGKILQVLGHLTKRMWREAVAVKSPHWPPAWLEYAGAAFILLFTLTTVILLMWGVLVTVGFGFVDLVSGSDLAQVVTHSVRQYLDNVGPSLGISGQLLWRYWAISGIVLYFTACVGLLGGRLGWAIYGLLTGAIVYAETSETSRLLMVCIVAGWWAVLSLLAFYSPNRNRRQSERIDGSREPFSKWFAPQAAASARQTAEDASLTYGYTDLQDYFDNRGHLALYKVAKDLGVKSDMAKALRLQHVPKGFPTGSKVSPKQKRAILEQCNLGEVSLSDMAEQCNVSVQTLRKWMKAEVRTEGSDSDSREARREAAPGDLTT